MKRIVLLLFCGVCLTSEMLAQNSRHGLGLEVVTSGVFSKPGSVGLSAKYQFGVSSLFRVEPELAQVPVPMTSIHPIVLIITNIPCFQDKE